jgi:hypothetical protein
LGPLWTPALGVCAIRGGIPRPPPPHPQADRASGFGVSRNPRGMSRFIQENSPELARATIELALDPETDQRVPVC